MEITKARKPQNTKAWAHPAASRSRTLVWPITSVKKSPMRRPIWSLRRSGLPPRTNATLSATSLKKRAIAPSR